jgi:ElaB/YqjD/DUF883 family membrane-anchored ribosome-binding protein
MSSYGTPSSMSSDLPSGVPGSVADPAVERIARGAHNAIDRVAGSAANAAERVRSTVGGAVDSVSGKVSDLASNRDQWVEGCRERVREHPLATLGIALAAGYVLARWSRP